jgi:hypothetical protein
MKYVPTRHHSGGRPKDAPGECSGEGIRARVGDVGEAWDHERPKGRSLEQLVHHAAPWEARRGDRVVPSPIPLPFSVERPSWDISCRPPDAACGEARVHQRGGGHVGDLGSCAHLKEQIAEEV